MICKKCIIPVSFPNVKFEDGVCSFCRDPRRSQINGSIKGHDELKRILNSRKGENYDCIVPTGGGKDSAYVLYYVVRELGLKPLAFFFDNGFIVDSAKRNLENICKRLSVDLETATATDFRRKTVVEAIGVSNHINQFWGVCTNCTNDAVTATRNEATRRKIPFIIRGNSKSENPSPSFGVEFDVTKNRPNNLRALINYISSYTNMFYCRNSMDFVGTITHKWIHDFYAIIDNFATNPMKGFGKLLPFWEAPFNNKSEQVIGFFDYIPYDPFRNIEILKREIGWQSPPNRETRNDCKLHSLVNFSNLMQTGITSDGFYYANLVREGLLSRDAALEREEVTKKELIRECRITLEELGFTNGIVDKFLNAQKFLVRRKRMLLKLRKDLSTVKQFLTSRT